MYQVYKLFLGLLFPGKERTAYGEQLEFASEMPPTGSHFEPLAPACYFEGCGAF